MPNPREVFVVHGRDEQARRALWRFLQKIAGPLEGAGCAVNRNGTDWLDTTPFAELDAYRRSFTPRSA